MRLKVEGPKEGAELPRPDQGVRGKKRQRNVSSFVLLNRLDADTRVVAMVTVGYYVDTIRRLLIIESVGYGSGSRSRSEIL